MQHTSRRAQRQQQRRYHFDRTILECVEALESRVLLSGNGTGAIQVTVLNDLNANGVVDAGEPPLAGWTVYLDNDKNGALSAGDTSLVTDGSGKALFGGLVNGKTDVGEVLPSGWAPSAGLSNILRVNVS